MVQIQPKGPRLFRSDTLSPELTLWASIMFVLVAKVNRGGALCREFFQPEEKGVVPGVVFGLLDGKKRAKQYPTEEEAIADIPHFRSVTGYNDVEIGVEPV